MRAGILALALLLGASVAAHAQDGDVMSPAWKSFSIEAGVGLMPLHMTESPSRDEEEAFAQLGQGISHNGTAPSFSLSAVWRTNRIIEMVLTGGVASRPLEIKQYDTFGIDPSGKPRYNLYKGYIAGTVLAKPVFSLCGQVRFRWLNNPSLTLYSGVGLGLTTVTAFVPMPDITPIAMRLGGRHFYFFGETTLGPRATFVHGGLGWRF